MKLNFYGLKDNIVGEFIYFFQSQNEGTMKRVVKSCLLTKEQNPFVTDMKDKSVYLLGEIETETGAIKAINPVFQLQVSQLRLELIQEIKIAKAEAGEKEPNADEVSDDE